MTRITAAVNGRMYQFGVDILPTDFFEERDTVRVWVLSISLRGVTEYLPVKFASTTPRPRTEDEHADVLKQCLIDECQAGYDMFTLKDARSLASIDIARDELAQAHRAAAAFDRLGISPSEAYHVANAITPATRSAAFRVLA